MSSTKTLVLEFDDFHWRSPENCLDTIDILVKARPDIKLSLFTVPNLNTMPIWTGTAFCKRVRGLCESNHIRIAIHGLTHDQEEFKNVDQAQAIRKLEHAETLLRMADIPFTKVFKGPHWAINEATVWALNKMSYTHLYSHRDYEKIADGFLGAKVFYNWNLKDEAPTDTDILIGHGHTHNVCENGITEVSSKILTFVEKHNPVFKFVDEI